MEVLYDIDRSRLKQFCSCFYNFMFELQLYTFIYTLYAHTHSLLLLLFSYIGSLVFFGFKFARSITIIPYFLVQN